MNELLIVAGEASGDRHGARMLSELRRLNPGVRAFGLGGDELSAAGMECLANASDIAVVGLVEALRVLPRARAIFRQLLAAVEERRPAVAVLIDSPGFNLRLARALAARGVRVVYYVSPQVWAWHRGRVRDIARTVDRMLVLFPFEADFYREHGVEAVHVGHPIVDEVPPVPEHVWDGGRPADGVYRVALLAGSRRSEIEALLPGLLEAGRLLGEELPVRLSLVRAPTVSAELIDEVSAGAGVDVERVSEDRFGHLAGCHLALCASGTATLEVGLVGTPLIVIYRLRGWTYLMGRLLVRLPHVSLVNLVLEAGVVPELIQSDARPRNLARRAAALLGDGAAIATMRSRLATLRERLGEGGASGRAAREVAAVMAATEVAA